MGAAPQWAVSLTAGTTAIRMPCAPKVDDTPSRIRPSFVAGSTHVLPCRTSVTESRFLKACRREQVDATPVWFMRQAGRYMAEYRALRERYSLLDICRAPESGDRGDAPACPPNRGRRRHPVLRPAAAPRTHGAPIRLHQGRRDRSSSGPSSRPPTSMPFVSSNHALPSPTCSRRSD